LAFFGVFEIEFYSLFSCHKREKFINEFSIPFIKMADGKFIAQIKYQELEHGIRGIVYSLEERIPFTSTGDTIDRGYHNCHGHLRKDIRPVRIVADPGYFFIRPPEFLFYANPTHEMCQPFLYDVYEWGSGYDYIDAAENPLDEYDYDIKGWKKIWVCGVITDLYDESAGDDGDSREVQIKKKFQVPANVARQRMKEFKEALAEFLKMIEKYYV